MAFDTDGSLLVNEFFGGKLSKVEATAAWARCATRHELFRRH
jgi:hypothetical protein